VREPLSEGTVLAYHGMDTALNAADLSWAQAAHKIVEVLALSGREWTSEDVWAALEGMGLATREPRALGGIIRDFSDRGVIRRSGWVTASRPVAHSRPLAVWIRA
jgi:hypothetical protein